MQCFVAKDLREYLISLKKNFALNKNIFFIENKIFKQQ